MSADTVNIDTKPGYKKTKLGWIPEEWEINKFQKVAKVIMGNSPKGASYNESEEGIPLINGPTEFTSRYPEKKQWTTNPTKLCQKGDILICVRGSSTGRVNIADDVYCIGRGVAALRTIKENDQTYFEYQLYKQLPRLLKLTSGSTFPNIKSKTVRNLLIPTPPIPEQKKIAEILSTWDKTITKLEQLIGKKEELKKGLMQQLLTGKKRLEGFTEKWEKVKVNDVFEFLRSISVARRDLKIDDPSSKILNIHYGDLHTKFKPITRLKVANNPRIPSIIKGYNYPSTIDYVQDGDLIVADASEDYEGVGECIEVNNLNGKKLTAGSHTFLLRDKSGMTVPGFRSLIFKNPEAKKKLKRVVTGSNVYGLSKTNFSSVKISLPSIEEQEKIVEITQGIESNIRMLRALEDTFKTQKRGLMQQLLTGKTRVYGKSES